MREALETTHYKKALAIQSLGQITDIRLWTTDIKLWITHIEL